MDENDAIKYDNAIRSVQEDEKKISNLVKENILVTTTTLSNFNSSLNKI